MFSTETTKCSCGCGKCGFNPCDVTCSNPVRSFGDYAYIYNTTAQTVAENAAFTFSANGPLSGSITHTAGTENIVINKTGVYLITFYAVTETADVEIAHYKNSLPVQGGNYSSQYGQVILSAQTGDIITVVNTGGAPIDLISDAGAVNASITIVRLF